MIIILPDNVRPVNDEKKQVEFLHTIAKERPDLLGVIAGITDAVCDDVAEDDPRAGVAARLVMLLLAINEAMLGESSVGHTIN